MQIEQIVIGKVNFVPYLKENRSLGCQSTKYEIIPTFGYEMFPYVNGWLIDWFLFQIKNIYIISGDNISIVWIADLWIGLETMKSVNTVGSSPMKAGLIHVHLTWANE